MKTFADNAARTWAINVSVSAVKRVRDMLGVNLLEIADMKSGMLDRLVTDPCLLCDILFCLVQPEAEAKGISDEDFGRALAGDALDQATDALLSEVVDFFPKGRRTVLRKILDKLAALQQKAVVTAMTRLEDPETDRILEEALTMAETRESVPTNSTSDAGNSAASPESIPESSPSVS